jgi:hypothetical protein
MDTEAERAVAPVAQPDDYIDAMMALPWVADVVERVSTAHDCLARLDSVLVRESGVAQVIVIGLVPVVVELASGRYVVDYHVGATLDAAFAAYERADRGEGDE